MPQKRFPRCQKCSNFLKKLTQRIAILHPHDHVNEIIPEIHQLFFADLLSIIYNLTTQSLLLKFLSLFLFWINLQAYVGT